MRLFAVSLFIALTPMLANAASFNCAKASHPLEHLICDNAELSKLDDAVASEYKAASERLFDNGSLRSQQKNWQQILRTRCAKSCAVKDVEKDYRDQLASLKSLTEETFDASYKTTAVATLTIRHLKDHAFDFDITRSYVDTPNEKLCSLPLNDAEAGAIAQRTSPDDATWENGKGCTLDFTTERDKKGDVTAINIHGTKACQAYCPGGKFLLDDQYEPANNWVAGNQ